MNKDEMTVDNILRKYSKEVIIKWVKEKYPVFLDKDLKKELDEAKADIEFDNISKEIDELFEKQKKLKEKPFNITVMKELEKTRKRISVLVEKQSKMVGW